MEDPIPLHASCYLHCLKTSIEIKVGGKKIQLRFYESVRSKSSTLNTEEGVSLPSDNLPEQESVLTCLTPHQQTKPHATNPPEIAKTDTLQRPGELSHTLRS